MPLDTQYYEFDAEIERLEAAMKETAEELAPLDDANPVAPQLAQAGQQLQSQLDGLRWAQNVAHLPEDEGGVGVWDEEVDGVTLCGLTGGEYGQVEDTVEGGQGEARVYFVAKGTVEAPYVSGDMGFKERVAAAAALPIGYLRWADSRINELMSVEGNGEPRFGDLLADARRKQTSTES